MTDARRKITLKFLKRALTGGALDDYAAENKLKIARYSDVTALLAEVYEETEEGEELYGTLGVEKEKWADYTSFHPNYDLINRFKIELFGKTGKLLGVAEERLIKELLMPKSSRIPLFTVILEGVPYIIDLERDSNKFLFPFFTNPRKKWLEIFQITKKALRNSFEVKRKHFPQRVASIDSKWGRKMEINIEDDELARNANFFHLLILFAGTTHFHVKILSKIHEYNEALSEGTLVIKPGVRAIELMSKEQVKQLYEEAEFAKTAKAKTKAKKQIPVKPAVPDVIEYPTPGKRIEEEYKRGIRKVRKIRKKKEAVPPEVEKTKVPTKKEVVLAEIDRTQATEELRAESEYEIKLPKRPPKIEEKPPVEELEPLHLEDSVHQIKGISEEVANTLEEVGISMVDDLIFIDAGVVADYIGIKSITKETIKHLQDMAHKQIQMTIKKDKELKEKYLKKYRNK
ncbi:MAG: hypothetical protein ACTSRS_12675 [Candidatus Helarchaeota archaeon]